MYAVVRAGGKQYRVAAGDVIRIEKTATPGETFSFPPADVLAVSPEAGSIVAAKGKATVSAQVLEEGRGPKIIVFKFKRKKQYKKTIGHRQSFSSVRILEIGFDGKKTSAPALEVKAKKTKVESDDAKHAKKAAPAKKSGAKKSTAKSKAPAKKAAAKKPSKKK